MAKVTIIDGKAYKQACQWAHNEDVFRRHCDDYRRRTGKSLLEERLANRVFETDPIARVHGCEVRVYRLPDAWRYTVVTPWMQNEGLGDLPERDDDRAIARLGEVMAFLDDTGRLVAPKSKRMP